MHCTVAVAESSGLQQRGLRRNDWLPSFTGFPFHPPQVNRARHPKRRHLMPKPSRCVALASIPVPSENCLFEEQFCRFSPSLPLNLDAIFFRRTATENPFPAIARCHGFAKNVEILFAVDAVISG